MRGVGFVLRCNSSFAIYGIDSKLINNFPRPRTSKEIYKIRHKIITSAFVRALVSFLINKTCQTGKKGLCGPTI